jgi:hypothetical protein
MVARALMSHPTNRVEGAAASITMRGSYNNAFNEATGQARQQNRPILGNLLQSVMSQQALAFVDSFGRPTTLNPFSLLSPQFPSQPNLSIGQQTKFHTLTEN